MTETGTCEKCQSEIDHDADRCPECGYEPGAGVATTVIGTLSMVALPLLAFLTVATVIAAVSAGDVLMGVVGIGVFGTPAAISGAFVYLYAKQGNRTPTDPSISQS